MVAHAGSDHPRLLQYGKNSILSSEEQQRGGISRNHQLDACLWAEKIPQEASRGVIESCYSTTVITSNGYTADFAINDGNIKNSCWIKLSDYGCLEGTDTCMQENSCKAFSGSFSEDVLDILIAGRENSPWVAFIAEKRSHSFLLSLIITLQTTTR